MLKWIVTLLVALAVLTALSPWLARFGLGRLPGDVSVRVKGRDYFSCRSRPRSCCRSR